VVIILRGIELIGVYSRISLVWIDIGL